MAKKKKTEPKIREEDSILNGMSIDDENFDYKALTQKIIATFEEKSGQAKVFKMIDELVENGQLVF